MSNAKLWAVVVAIVTLIAVTPILYAETPTKADFAACNAEARAAVEAKTAAPTLKDHARAESARRAQAAMVPSTDSGASNVTEHSDGQLVGMVPEGTTDPAYHAGYRTCMRRSGF